MRKVIGYLAYNRKNERMGIVNEMYKWEDYGLNCGKIFEVFLNNEWKADRLEYNFREWYLVYSKLKGKELEGLKVRF